MIKNGYGNVVHFSYLFIYLLCRVICLSAWTFDKVTDTGDPVSKLSKFFSRFYGMELSKIVSILHLLTEVSLNGRWETAGYWQKPLYRSFWQFRLCSTHKNENNERVRIMEYRWLKELHCYHLFYKAKNSLPRQKALYFEIHKQRLYARL